MKELINMGDRTNCPRCDGPILRSWGELTDEEKEVVGRLPAPAEYSLKERQQSHQWCPRCWFESLGDAEPRTA